MNTFKIQPYRKKAFDPTHSFQLGYLNHSRTKRHHEVWFSPLSPQTSRVNLDYRERTFTWTYHIGSYTTCRKRFANRAGYDTLPVLRITSKKDPKLQETAWYYRRYTLWAKSVPETVIIFKQIVTGDEMALRVFCDFLHDDNKRYEWELLPFEFRDVFFRMFCSNYAACIRRELARGSKDDE